MAAPELPATQGWSYSDFKVPWLKAAPIIAAVVLQKDLIQIAIGICHRRNANGGEAQAQGCLE